MDRWTKMDVSTKKDSEKKDEIKLQQMCVLSERCTRAWFASKVCVFRVPETHWLRHSGVSYDHHAWYTKLYDRWLLIFFHFYDGAMKHCTMVVRITDGFELALVFCRWHQVRQYEYPLFIRCCGHSMAFDKQIRNRNFLALLWLENRGNNNHTTMYALSLLYFLIKSFLFSCFVTFEMKWNDRLETSRQTNKIKWKMAFDLPVTPDNVNNTNKGKYIANIWSRVPICRRRPAKKQTQNSCRLKCCHMHQMYWLKLFLHIQFYFGFRRLKIPPKFAACQTMSWYWIQFIENILRTIFFSSESQLLNINTNRSLIKCKSSVMVLFFSVKHVLNKHPDATTTSYTFQLKPK